MDIFTELKKRADREIEWIKEEISKTDDSNKKYRYRKIRVGIVAMLEHIYEVEEEYKKQSVKTWGYKIRSMSDEELAEFFEKYGNCDLCALNREECLAGKGCKNGFLQYLQSEAE